MPAINRELHRVPHTKVELWCVEHTMAEWFKPYINQRQDLTSQRYRLCECLSVPYSKKIFSGVSAPFNADTISLCRYSMVIIHWCYAGNPLFAVWLYRHIRKLSQPCQCFLIILWHLQYSLLSYSRYRRSCLLFSIVQVISSLREGIPDTAGSAISQEHGVIQAQHSRFGLDAGRDGRGSACWIGNLLVRAISLQKH